MGKLSGKFSRTYWRGYDLSPQTNTMKVRNTATTPEVTGQGVDQKSYVVGVGEGACEQHGFVADGANESHAVLSGAIGTTGAFIAPFGTHVGAAAAMGSSVCLSEYSPETQVDGAGEFNAKYMNQEDGGGIEFGWLLAVLDTRSTATPTSHNRGAGSNAGLRAYLVQTANGAPATISVEGSTDNSSWSNLGDFTAVSGRHGTAIAVAGSIPQYVRATVSGGTATFAVAYRAL